MPPGNLGQGARPRGLLAGCGGGSHRAVHFSSACMAGFFQGERTTHAIPRPCALRVCIADDGRGGSSPVGDSAGWTEGLIFVNNTSAAATSKGIDPVRCASITSGLLILVFAASAFGCATGWNSESATLCPHPSTRPACVPKKPGTRAAGGSACGRTLKSLPGQCSLRTFTQFQFAELHRFEIPSPLRHAGGKVSPSSNSVIIVSSIGSPETDRGPPSC